MTIETPGAREATLDPVRASWRGAPALRDALPDLQSVDPLNVPTVAETAEAVIEDLDAPLAAAPALLDGVVTAAAEPNDRETGSTSHAASAPLVVSIMRPEVRRPVIDDRVGVLGKCEAPSTPLDDYAKAVLYNGLGHYKAARTAAARACESGDVPLLEGALAELVEASARSGRRSRAVAALRRLEARAQVSGSEWALGLAACGRALLNADEDCPEESYREAIERLGSTTAPVALGRVRLLYGEWLRRQGRRVDARQELTLAQSVFSEVGLGGFAERAGRELLATGATVRKRTDDTRLDLTAQEALIAELAAGGYTNPEIGDRLFLSPRTVEWHLRKVFTKLGVTSRKELYAVLPRTEHANVSA